MRLWTSAPVQFLREGLSVYFSRRVAQAAACLAYFVLVTVFPLLICLSYLLGLANIDVASLLTDLQGILPVEALDILEGYLFYISYNQSSGLFAAGLAGCWLSSAAAYRTIAQVIRDVYEVKVKTPVRNMIASIVFPLGLMLTLALSVLVVVTGQHTLELIAQHIPLPVQVMSLWGWLRYVLLFSVFFLFLLTLLTMAAPRGTPRTPMMASSLAAAVALVVSSGVFSWFIGQSSRYSVVYGSLMSVVVLLVWLYLCGQILFLAISFTSVWYRRREKA